MAYQESPYQKFTPVDSQGNIIGSSTTTTSGSDASASKQQSQIDLETQIRDICDELRLRLPSALVGDRLKTDVTFTTIPAFKIDQTTPGTTNKVNIGTDGSVGISGNVSVTGSFYLATQPISAIALPLPSNAATDSMLQQVRDAIKAQIAIASTIFTDNSGAFYIRRDLVNEATAAITVTFTDPSGSVATPGAGLKPLATVDKDVITDFYDVITSGTGYSIGDLLSRVAILDANSATPTATFIWLNLSQGTILSSSPTSANIERANENVGSRQVGSWAVTANLGATDTGNLASLSTAIGTPITGAAMPTGGVGLYGWLSGIWKLISDRIPTLGVKTAALSFPVTLSSDGAFSTNFGATSDTGSIVTTGSNSFLALFKGLIGTLLAKGQALMASSLSIAIASDQATITAIASQADVQAVRDRLMAAGTSVTYLGTSAGANIKASTGAINSFICTNNNSTLTRYFQIFNKITAPILGDTPAFIPLAVFPNNGFLIVDQATIGGSGIALNVGCSWGYSTTQFTYTAAPASECGLTVRFS